MAIANLANSYQQAPRRFAVQEVFEILLQKPRTKEAIAYLDDLTTSTLENTME